jgi:hypothetical protein
MTGPSWRTGWPGVPRAPGSPSLLAGTGWAGQGGCGSGPMRCQAVVMASAHGQVAWIFSRRRRPPRTRWAAACSTRTQRPGLGPGQVAVQGQQLEPGEQDLPGHRRGQPRGIDAEAEGGEMAQAGLLTGADGVLDAGVDQVRGVAVGAWPSQPLVAAARFVAHRECRPPSTASNKVSLVPRWGRSRRAKTRIALGQVASWSPAGSRAAARSGR